MSWASPGSRTKESKSPEPVAALGLLGGQTEEVPRMSRFDWIVGAVAMMVAGYESMSLIGGVVELLAARRDAGIEGSGLDIHTPPGELSFAARALMRTYGVTRISKAEYEVSSTDSTRFERSFRDGECDGFRIVTVPVDSIFTALGFQPGDVIQYVNGIAITSGDSALFAYQHLRDAAYVDVGFERHGIALTRRYWLH